MPAPGTARRGPGRPKFAPPPAFDRSEALETLDGDEELFLELSALFVADAPRLLAAVRSAVERGDGWALGNAGHALKGSLSCFAAPTAFEAAFRLEVLGHSGAIGAAHAALVELEAALDQLIPALAATAFELVPA